jgi:hypothetical protein
MNYFHIGFSAVTIGRTLRYCKQDCRTSYRL